MRQMYKGAERHNFCEKLNYLIKSRNVDVKSVAHGTGIAEYQIVEYLSGEKRPMIPNLLKLARYFKVAPGWLNGNE